MIPYYSRLPGGRFTAPLSKIKSLPLVNLISPSSVHVASEEEKRGFLKAQNLAYQCALEVAQDIQPGWTESQTAALMDTWLRDNGVKSFFHRSFAWFGERTRFLGFTRHWNFYSGKRQLKEDDVIILDTAPIVDRFAGDIGYTFSLQPHAGLKQAQDLLLDLRKELPLQFESDRTVKAIWKEVDEKIKAHGFDNCHAMYPFQVLGHRLHKSTLANLPSLTFPFGIQAYWEGLTRGLYPELLSPEHVGSKTGIWAIEPHLGGEGFGAKFEEILVVDENKAYWLSDEVPHLRKDWIKK